MKLNIRRYIEKRLEEEKIIRWCNILENVIRNMYKMLALIKKKSEVSLTRR